MYHSELSRAVVGDYMTTRIYTTVQRSERPQLVRIVRKSTPRPDLTETYHALWAEIHSQQDATPEWFADWVSRVPNFDCSCRNWLTEYLKTNPVRYDDFAAWAIEMHNAVNIKIGKPIWVESAPLSAPLLPNH